MSDLDIDGRIAIRAAAKIINGIWNISFSGPDWVMAELFGKGNSLRISSYGGTVGSSTLNATVDCGPRKDATADEETAVTP